MADNTEELGYVVVSWLTDEPGTKDVTGWGPSEDTFASPEEAKRYIAGRGGVGPHATAVVAELHYVEHV